MPSPSISADKVSPGHNTRSAAVADIVPALASLGTLIVIDVVDPHPNALTTSTV